MIGRFIRYWIPGRGLRHKLPLLSRDFSSEVGTPADPHKAELLKMAAVARTDADAQRVLDRYPNQHTAKVIKFERRGRRRRRWLKILVSRFKGMW